MKNVLRVLRVLALGAAGVLALWPLVTVFAVAVGNITTMTANPSNTSMVLTWTKASSSNNTLIQYRTDTFPADNRTNGIQVYFSTGFQVTVGANVTSDTHVAGDNVTALTAGQVYYFAAWGEVSGNYSTTPFHLVMSTLAMAIPNGGTTSPQNTLPVPSVPTSMNQSPTTGGFQLEPFTSIVN